MISFSIRGGREVAVKFMDSLSLANKVVHVADICTCVLHPASSTHRQLTDEQLVAAGITPGLIRLSVGLEHIDDILDDLKKASRPSAERLAACWDETRRRAFFALRRVLFCKEAKSFPKAETKCLRVRLTC